MKARYGLVLAGGHGRRFGADKGLAPWAGEPMRERAWRLVAERAESCWLSLRPDQAPPPDRPVLEDAHPGEGPLRALADAAAARPAGDWLVLACDLPRLDGASLDAVLAADRGGVHAVLLAAPGRDPEPLAGLWTAAGTEALVAAAARGERAFRALWPALRVRRVAPRSPEALFNRNRP